MSTRKELIDQVRADQRARSARTRADSPKSAIVGIGDRDPLTGLHEVMLPDGSVETGEKQFNSSLPKGSQVLGVPQSTGGWLLDERDVQPIKPTRSPSPMGKIKVLFSTIVGDERVFWVGGDRATPKRIYAIQKDLFIRAANISNAGDGDKFFVGLKYGEIDSDRAASTFLTISPGAKWTLDYVSRFDYEVIPDPIHVGHGFWTQTIPGFYYRGMDRSFTSFSQFLGRPRFIAGGFSYANYTNSVLVTSDDILVLPPTAIGLVVDIYDQSFNAISPNIDKRSHYKTGVLYFGDDNNPFTPDFYSFEDIDSYFTRLLGRNGKSAVYAHSIRSSFVAIPVNFSTPFFLDCTTKEETEIGGDLGEYFLESLEFRAMLMNLVGNQLYWVDVGINFSQTGSNQTVVNSTLQVESSVWDFTHLQNLTIDVYDLGANTTKRSRTAKVYALKPNAKVHSISYHP